MAPEEQSQMCSNSGGSGIGNFIRSSSSSKRHKAKKVPQRGLGVAQLEKIRIEEQQKKDVIVAPMMQSPATISSSSSQKSPYLSLPIPNFHLPPNQPASTRSIPFSVDLAAENLMFRPTPSAQQIEIPPWPPGNGNFQKVWSVCEHNLQKENAAVDPLLPLKANFSLNYDAADPIWPLPSLMQRAQQNKQSSSAMVSSTSAPTLLNFQMEPPSNQIYNGNCAFLWSEEKMAGMKRPYPFPLENPAGPSFHYKLPHISYPIDRRDEHASSNGNTISFDPNNSGFRGLPCSTSTSTSEPNTKKRIKETVGVCEGDFLTLAPPVSTSMSQSSKSKDASPNSAYYDLEFPDFETLPYHQGCMEDSIFRQGRGGLDLPQPYYSFFPPATGQATTTMTKCNGAGQAVRESVDLNLKL